MNREEIQRILPHRDDMLLLDEVTRDGEWACGSYHVRGDEFFLRGHFPGNPVVPGVILCEILAQSACALLPEGSGTPFYAGLRNVRFRAPVRPGDDLRTRCRIVRARPPFYFAEGSAEVNGKRCVTAEFSFALMGE